ncbi:uncharacterized protein LOC105770594 isoform X2 [Gossypium raimondii]|uniref:uncharacterized protein LOC105770594 isoform X2 n=1 Tax=Gossypium raimondii TaxID=29730 RepID=UPI00063B096E|nr:uncharacterized protein LOC105770594 isoform X2 [Gossypium raimondii]
MFDFLLKPNFYTKCKSAIKMIKLRLETIKKKRNAVEKYLKNDVADLLKNGLDENAYGRASGLLMEQKRTACYDFIEQFCECISKNLSVMQKQSECPEECREAVPSLLYAAARFADLPELRDLRTIFTEKYGNSLDSYLNQEKLKAEPPTKDTKLQLMHDIAQEFSFEWDSKALEQKLFKPPPLEQNNADDDRYNLYRSKNNTFEKSNNEDENGLSNLHRYRRQKGNEADLTSRGRMEDTDDKFKQNSSSEDEVTDQDIPKGSSATDESVSEDGIENRKPFYYRFIPPPYVRPALGKDKSITEDPMAPNDNTENENNNKWNEPVAESKPEPRSVWRRPLRPPPGSKGLSGFGNNVAANMSRTSTQMEGSDMRDEEEKRMDELLVHYSKKKSPFEWVSRWKTAILAPPPGKQESEGTSKAPGLRSTKSNPISLPGRVASFSKETTSSTERAGRHTRAASDGFAGHVHPKLPDYDDLATRLAALRRQ